MSQDSIYERALLGARKLLTTCLSLNSGDVFALFWDGSTRQPARVLRQAARDLDLVIRDRFVPIHEQIAFKGKLTKGDIETLVDARGIVTCLSSRPQATAYRRELLKVGPSFDNYFGHMPGATLTILANAVNIDHVVANKRCDDLALAFTTGKAAVLRTYDFDEGLEPIQEYALHLDLVGFDRSPISSTGIIAKGTWGNIPGGEVFIAPMERCTRGKFALNGAFKNCVVSENTVIHIEFQEGRVSRIDGRGREYQLFKRLISQARRRGGLNYDALAELGVGVNSGVTELTGVALFDEKCAGTAHIAIGDNARYGGKSPADIHEDFITKSPSLEIDGKEILSFGKDVFNPIQFRDSIYSQPSQMFKIKSDDFFVLNEGVEIEPTVAGRLRVRRFVVEGRICEYTVGDDSTSSLLFSICRLLPNRVQEVVGRAQNDLGLSEGLVARALEILVKHHVAYAQ